MSYAATRRLILAVGLGVLLLLAFVLYVRRVDTVEIVAVLLFIPVFVAFTIWQAPGGLVAGALAALVYAVLRAPAIDAVGASTFGGLIAGRAVGYLAFGGLGGWADAQLQRSLEKLDVYDQIDDATGLQNARAFLADTDLEMSRAERYKTIFSVVVVDVPAAPLEALGRRRRAAVLAELGAKLRDAVRSVDRATHARDGAVHRFAVVCPETGREGARVFTDRLADQLAAFLTTRGVAIEAPALMRTSMTYPGDDEAVDAIRAQFERIERAEHPEHPHVADKIPRAEV